MVLTTIILAILIRLLDVEAKNSERQSSRFEFFRRASHDGFLLLLYNELRPDE